MTNLEKHLWKDVTKARLIEYYHTDAPNILPYLKDWPQSLHIKNINAGAPEFLKVFELVCKVTKD